MDFSYAIPRIPACQAKVYFNADFNSLNYASEWYNNKRSYELANTASIIQEATTSGIDADLAGRSPISITTTELSNGTVKLPVASHGTFYKGFL
jgi:hypothetical protein